MVDNDDFHVLVLLALNNAEVRVYRDKVLADTIQVPVSCLLWIFSTSYQWNEFFLSMCKSFIQPLFFSLLLKGRYTRNDVRSVRSWRWRASYDNKRFVDYCYLLYSHVHAVVVLCLVQKACVDFVYYWQRAFWRHQKCFPFLGGGLAVKILKRTANFDSIDSTAGK